MIQRNAIRLLTLVEELLDLSRIEANKLVLAEKPVLFYQFLARVMATFAPIRNTAG
jgi:signal transduction histidine kinase